MFVGIHALLAAQTNTPELVMDEDEGKQFMVAVQNVARHYSIETTQKGIDVAALVGTVAAIYGTRIAAISIRRRHEKANPDNGSNVMPFPNLG